MRNNARIKNITLVPVLPKTLKNGFALDELEKLFQLRKTSNMVNTPQKIIITPKNMFTSIYLQSNI